MKRLILLIPLLILLCASKPLICYVIGWDLQFHRVPCRSSEFDTRPQPVEPEPTFAPTATQEPTATLDWPLPYATPTFTPTPEPYPVPTFEVTPYPMYEWVY